MLWGKQEAIAVAVLRGDGDLDEGGGGRDGASSLRLEVSQRCQIQACALDSSVMGANQLPPTPNPPGSTCLFLADPCF